MHTAERVGETRALVSEQTHFHCVPAGRVDTWTAGALADCRDGGHGGGVPLSLTMKAISVAPGPRIFLIEDLLSVAEVGRRRLVEPRWCSLRPSVATLGVSGSIVAPRRFRMFLEREREHARARARARACTCAPRPRDGSRLTRRRVVASSRPIHFANPPPDASRRSSAPSRAAPRPRGRCDAATPREPHLRPRHDEVRHLVAIGSPNVKRSMTGQSDSAFQSETRTSKNTWVKRAATPIVDAIFRRAADVLQLDEALVSDDANAELLQASSNDVCVP